MKKEDAEQKMWAFRFGDIVVEREAREESCKEAYAGAAFSVRMRCFASQVIGEWDLLFECGKTMKSSISYFLQLRSSLHRVTYHGPTQ